MRRFIYQLKRVKLRDIVQVWKLPIALVCAPFYRIKHKDLWIVCEDRNEARDNGYWLFKHVRTEHKEQECVYAISSKSPDFDKIKELGDWVEYGTLKHWILYIASSKKISSQKAGNPNAAIFYFLEVYGLMRNKRVFLQHGVIFNDLKWLYYDVTKMSRFICGARPEYEFIRSTFGYPPENVVYTGLCRFDGLHEMDEKCDNLILIMPTWREWIADEDGRLFDFEHTRKIEETEYFRTWTDLLCDAKLEELSKKYCCKFIFFPHRNMQKYMEYLPKSNSYLEVADASKYTVQELIKKASVMITDYSSVFVDMVYMKKPVVFYQFDYDKFRKGQYGEGYFSYKDNYFGESCPTKGELMDELERIIEKGFRVDDLYLEEHKKYFVLYDANNCERVFSVIKNA